MDVRSGERALDDGVVLGVEVELEQGTGVGLDGVGLEGEGSVQTDLDLLDGA